MPHLCHRVLVMCVYMKKVFLYGYWKHNLGDDLFLKSFLNRYPNTTVYIITSKRYRAYYEKMGVISICDDTFIYHVKNYICKKIFGRRFVFKKYTPYVDASILLGGSLFIEYPTWRKGLASWFTEIQKYSTKTFALGCNFGPYNSDEFLNFVKKYVNKIDGAAFRDNYSVELLKSDGNVRKVPDIAFGLLAMNSFDIPSSPYPDCYVISVLDPGKRVNIQNSRQKYFESIEKIAEYLYEKGKKPVVLMTSCSELGDTDVALEIARRINTSGVQKCITYIYEDLLDALALIKNAKGMIATHFHTMLISMIYSVPMFPIIYNIKMHTLLSDLNLTDIPQRDIEDIIWDETLESDMCKALASGIDLPNDLFDEFEQFYADIDPILIQ